MTRLFFRALQRLAVEKHLIFSQKVVNEEEKEENEKEEEIMRTNERMNERR